MCIQAEEYRIYLINPLNGLAQGFWCGVVVPVLQPTCSSTESEAVPDQKEAEGEILRIWVDEGGALKIAETTEQPRNRS